MLLTLQVVAVLSVAVAMSLALAHALEFPGKLRLDEQTYKTVQSIYYPGFTIGGIGEPLAIITTLLLMFAMRNNRAVFWYTLTAFVALAAMHAMFWFITQPTNRYWLKNQQLSKAGQGFFAVGLTDKSGSTENEHLDWKRLRNRWEYSHIGRAILSGVALIALVVAIAT